MNLKDFLNYLKSSIKTTIRNSVFLLTLLIAAQNVSAQVQPKDTNYVKIDTSKFVMQKSPWGAVLRSAIIPGLGQFYNKSYWKIPVVWGFLGWCGYYWIQNNNSYKQYRDLYSQNINSDINPSTLDFYHKAREFYKDQRDQFAVYIGLTYFLTLVDAYVDAQLFDFDVSKINSVNFYNISVKIKF
jgi:hypothetical protein